MRDDAQIARACKSANLAFDDVVVVILCFQEQLVVCLLVIEMLAQAGDAVKVPAA
jgi:hypothetical protein